jgi:hypothetical protein
VEIERAGHSTSVGRRVLQVRADKKSAVKMSSVNVPTFYGMAHENVKQFIKFVKHNARAEYQDEKEQEESKILILISNCKGEAPKHVNDLDDETKES